MEMYFCAARTTNAIERLHEEFKRRIKTQTVLPSADTAAMLFWALLASGQINMRKVATVGRRSPQTSSIDRLTDSISRGGRATCCCYFDFVLCAAVAQTGYPFIDCVCEVTRPIARDNPGRRSWSMIVRGRAA